MLQLLHLLPVLALLLFTLLSSPGQAVSNMQETDYTQQQHFQSDAISSYLLLMLALLLHVCSGSQMGRHCSTSVFV